MASSKNTANATETLLKSSNTSRLKATTDRGASVSNRGAQKDSAEEAQSAVEQERLGMISLHLKQSPASVSGLVEEEQVNYHQRSRSHKKCFTEEEVFHSQVTEDGKERKERKKQREGNFCLSSSSLR